MVFGFGVNESGQLVHGNGKMVDGQVRGDGKLVNGDSTPGSLGS